ncbi:serine/threonine protein kinase [Hahella sp. CCB-MM4]|uniref:serine/threonine protein kinase n=1 Tax=Hahella sp. (strain CCB-MM4) TaxID=1926491 RepID=UPI000B9B1EB3|nr:serine/threonine-protein kinase [Hahella sp. CCB-MM4]OZG72136.1 serine/threonine protein kinase [Hahella sp. CCB-MM4]
MNQDRWTLIQQIFDQVADLPSTDRQQFLATHCPDDEIKKEVLDLLQADEEVGDLLPSSFTMESPEATLVLPRMHPDTLVGPYRIISKIGEGGMGWVFKAEDTRLDRYVALKCLAPAVASEPGIKERLLLEAKAISRLDHPNVCIIHDMGHTEDGGLYIAMQFYTGKTLEKLLSKGPLDLKQAIKIAKQIAFGLSAAHQHHIVHRDIKPANIMIQDDGVVKILDFGIAKLADTEITLAGARMGTLAYMAPEQLEGDDVGPYTDIWSLATVLFEMLTGRPLFTGDKASNLLNAVMNQEPPLNDPVLEAQPHLLRLLQAMLIRDIDLRLNSMTKVVQWLATYQQHLSQNPNRRRPQEEDEKLHTDKVTFTDQYLMRLAAVLTAHIGPTAPVLIQRYTESATSYEGLIMALVSHLPAHTRQSVVSQLKAIQP